MKNNASPIDGPAGMSTPANLAPRTPAWAKWGFTGFMAVLVPIYWANYGPTDFLYFCDTALFLTLFTVWMAGLVVAFYVPTHFILRCFGRRTTAA